MVAMDWRWRRNRRRCSAFVILTDQIEYIKSAVHRTALLACFVNLSIYWKNCFLSLIRSYLLDIILEIVEHLLFERVGEEFIAHEQLFHSFCALFGYRQGHLADLCDLACLASLNCHKNACGAEQTDCEFVSLAFGGRSFAELLHVCVFCMSQRVAEKNMAELVCDGKS